MDELPREDVERTARLARLGLAEEEAARLAAEMASVLRHFREIRRLEEGAGEADRGGSPPGGGSPGGTPGGREALRPDEVDPDPLSRPVSGLAPEWRDGHFVVPRLPSVGGEESP